jgi:Leu/Phe-tRNA-protein transferase
MLESLMGTLAFLGQCHSILKLALHPLYQILQQHTSTTSNTLPTIPMHHITPHLKYILNIFHLHLPGAFKRQLTSRYYHISHNPDTQHVITDASGHQGYAFVTSNGSYQDFWTDNQQQWPIHTKELFAIYQALYLNST